MGVFGSGVSSVSVASAFSLFNTSWSHANCSLSNSHGTLRAGKAKMTYSYKYCATSNSSCPSGMTKISSVLSSVFPCLITRCSLASIGKSKSFKQRSCVEIVAFWACYEILDFEVCWTIKNPQKPNNRGLFPMR